MVTNFLINTLAGLVQWVIGLFPTFSTPGFFSQAASAISSIGTQVSSVGAWLPIGLIGAVVTAWAVTFAAGVAIKVIRIIASYFTLGGGSAA